MNDKYTKAFINKLCVVCADQELKMAVLNKYIQQCNHLHHIAFYEWRLKYRTEAPKEIDESSDEDEKEPETAFTNDSRIAQINEAMK